MLACFWVVLRMLRHVAGQFGQAGAMVLVLVLALQGGDPPRQPLKISGVHKPLQFGGGIWIPL